MNKHRKHAKLPLRSNGIFGPNEIAIVGTKCNVISDLVNRVSEKLGAYKIAYMDASHSKEHSKNPVDSFTFHAKGTAELQLECSVNMFNQRIQISQYDYVFINGNHYQGEKQVLILDPEKEASVKKRLDQLNQIQFVIKMNEDAEFFDCLLEKYPTIKNLHCYSLNDTEAISRHLENLIQEKIAPVQGLVLAGGKSLRMGTDKGALQFYGKNQRDHAIEMLKANQLKTFLSVRSEQDIEMENKIEDTFIGLGPFGAICSAFQQNPNTAWLVLATDLPFVDESLIQELLKRRNPSKAATAIKGKNKEFPEPLITIWEPKSYTLLMNYLAQGYSCPRKVLINSNIEIVEIDDNLIRNINTPEEYHQAHKELNG